MIKNQNNIDENIKNNEKRGGKVDLKKKANYKEITDRPDLKKGYKFTDLDNNNIKGRNNTMTTRF